MPITNKVYGHRNAAAASYLVRKSEQVFPSCKWTNSQDVPCRL